MVDKESLTHDVRSYGGRLKRNFDNTYNAMSIFFLYENYGRFILTYYENSLKDMTEVKVQCYKV